MPSLASSSRAVLLVAAGLVTSPASASPWQEKVDAPLLSLPAGSEAEFLVLLAEQADLQDTGAIAGKAAKGRAVFDRLRATAERTQGAVREALDALGAEHRSYWVANMVWVRGSHDVVVAMASRDDVRHLFVNPGVPLRRPVVSSDDADPSDTAGVEWNIALVGAPGAWAAGVTGQGVVIGGQDTGYHWDHPALKGHYRGWNGSGVDHSYNWHDAIHAGGGRCGANSPAPCDDDAHGTHTMGTMVGDDGAGNQIGMAPGARWIGCRNMDQGVGTPATYAECFQWFIAPTDSGGQNPDPGRSPDIINNSWSCPPSEGCTNPEALRLVVENTRAAGILVVVSAGNAGPGCASIAEAPAIYEASFSVGATNASDGIAGFSSRGPVGVDGSNRLKPDVAAPGVNIRSSVPGGGYEGGWSGTSMAAPHVSGLAALLISSSPNLSGNVAGIEARVEQAALALSAESCGSAAGQVPNTTFGHGRIRTAIAFVGDVDGSGLIDGWDLILLAWSFGLSDGDPRFDARADLDKSGTVDGVDLALLAGSFGRRV